MGRPTPRVILKNIPAQTDIGRALEANIVEIYISDCGFIREASARNINFDVSPSRSLSLSLATRARSLSTSRGDSAASLFQSASAPFFPSLPAVKADILLFSQNEVESGEIYGIPIDISLSARLRMHTTLCAAQAYVFLSLCVPLWIYLRRFFLRRPVGVY